MKTTDSPPTPQGKTLKIFKGKKQKKPFAFCVCVCVSLSLMLGHVWGEGGLLPLL